MDITAGQPAINVGGNGGMFGGDGIMLLAFFAMMMGGFGGGWGGNRGPVYQPTGDQAPVSSAQFQSGMNMQNLADQNRDINSNVNNVYHDLMASLGDRYSELQRDIAANSVLIQQVMANSQQCCCQIKQEIAGLNLDNEKRFAALNSKMDANTIQQLRDQIFAQSQGMQDMRIRQDMESMFQQYMRPNFPPLPMAAGF